MSAEQDQMLAAASALETHLQGAADAFTDYLETYHVVSTAAYSEHDNRQLTLENSVGGNVLFDLLVLRIRALGLGVVLERGKKPGTLDVPLNQALQAPILAQVP